MMTTRRRVILGMMVALVAIGGIVAAEVMWNSGHWRLTSPAILTAFLAACLGVAAASMMATSWKWYWRLAILALATLVFFTPAYMLLTTSRHRPYPWGTSRGAMSQILKATNTYRLEFDGHFPFDERGPLESLALLYPRYIDAPLIFRDPGLALERGIEVEPILFPKGTSLAGMECWYGYTWRVPPDAPPDFAIVADLPPPGFGSDTEWGVNVGYPDGRILWQTTPFCSHDPSDNIFAPEPGWEPDTDSYIRQ